MRNKYGAKKTVCGSGHTHDSKLEALRCNELNLMQRAGEISDLEIQVEYELLPPIKYKALGMPNEYGVKYKADFVYKKGDKTIVEDTKGKKLAAYVIKRKLFKKLYCTDGNTIFIETN